MSRLAQFLDALRAHAQLPCLEGDGAVHSYARLLEECARWRHELDTHRVPPGSVVGLRADFSLHSVAALLAIFERAAVAALIPRDREAGPYLADSHAAAFLELDVQGGARWESFDGQQPHPLLDRLRTQGQGGVVIFTSGSTGRPKAALQSVERFLHKFRKPGRRFRTLAFLLFDHVAGLDTLFYTLSSGGALVLPRRRDPATICELIERHRVEVLPASPSFLRLLCLSAEGAQRDLSSLKIVTYGSEPMDSGTLERLNQRFPGLQITQKYGTTETGSPRTVSRGNDSLWLKIRSEQVETKVVDEMLWIRSEGTILGYLNAPSPVDAQGWYCTGDLVDVDGEWIRFRGRASETINVGGEKVSPAEVEQTILSLDFVREAVVRGEKHALMGQIVTAAVVLQEGVEAQAAAKAIRLRCRERLAAYKVPVKIDFVVGGLVNDRQKMQRRGGSAHG